jgi:hypothetical protein
MILELTLFFFCHLRAAAKLGLLGRSRRRSLKPDPKSEDGSSACRGVLWGRSPKSEDRSSVL